MIASEPTSKAVIRPVEGGKEIRVHFNPVSLQYSVSNQLKEDGPDKKQYVTQTTAKLTMDLIFDTTDSGKDVRLVTQDLAGLMDVETKKGDKKKKFPKVVEFSWGLYVFTGILESFKETIDYFSNNGVPLRSTVNCTLARQKVTLTATDPGAGPASPGLAGQDIVDAPVANNQSATDVAQKGGNPAAGRQVAAANNRDSMRFPGGGKLAVSDNIKLNGPVAFASAAGSASTGFGAGASAGAGFGAGASAGFGASAGAGFGVSASAGAGFGVSASASTSFGAGASASAGVSASAGAFANLRPPSPGVASVEFSAERLLPPVEVAYSTSGGSSFQLGGKAMIEGSASLRADVGATATISSRIRFEDK